jgi:Ca2+-binding RTX toxin-like protein
MSRGRFARQSLLASLITVAALMASASPAEAAVTIGQVDPSIPPAMSSCAGVVPQAMAQPSVTSGNSYVVPATVPQGAITSWTHNAFGAATQPVTMKIFRLVAGTTYRVVGHDGPRTLSGPGPITFSGISVPVQAGDVLGLNAGTGTGFVQCMFVATGDTMLYANPSDAADGQEVTFTTVPDRRPNILAVVEPDCDKDGFGDESQDPDLSSCAPGTTPTGPITGPGGTPVTCKGLNATILGTEGNDVRTGSQGQDVIVALGGNDTLSGVAGNDVICGGKGNDTLRGGQGNDFLSGQKGSDKLLGKKGNDKLSGKKGNDRLKGGGGKDICKGGKGTDTASKCEVEQSI